jgi:hypothetical protein
MSKLYSTVFTQTAFQLLMRVEPARSGWKGSIRPEAGGPVQWSGAFPDLELAKQWTYLAARRLAGLFLLDDAPDGDEGKWDRVQTPAIDSDSSERYR